MGTRKQRPVDKKIFGFLILLYNNDLAEDAYDLYNGDLAEDAYDAAIA